MEYSIFMIIFFYCTFLASIVIEFVFLFHIPYYYYSNYLKNLKIIRIIMNIINLLIDFYIIVIRYAENLIKKQENEKGLNGPSSRTNRLFDKILIIIAFSLSSVMFILNIIGIGLTAKYLETFDSSFIQNSLYIDTLFFLIENTLLSLCWLHFTIFWGFNIKDFMKNRKKIRVENNNYNNNNIDNSGNNVNEEAASNKIPQGILSESYKFKKLNSK